MTTRRTLLLASLPFAAVAVTPSVARADKMQQAQQLWNTRCASCHVIGHGQAVRGVPHNFTDLTLTTRQHDAAWLKSWILAPNDVKPDAQMAIVCDYYERPCPKWPNGRWITTCNRRVIVDARKIDPTAEYFWQDYPLKDADGEILDECLLHRLVYSHDPDDDDDLGLTWQIADFELSAQDCINKMLEYKNRGLNLQMMAPTGSILNKPDDVPGAIRYYKRSPNGEKPEWEDPPSAQILNALIQIFNLILEQMQSLSLIHISEPTRH